MVDGCFMDVLFSLTYFRCFCGFRGSTRQEKASLEAFHDEFFALIVCHQISDLTLNVVNIRETFQKFAST